MTTTPDRQEVPLVGARHSDLVAGLTHLVQVSDSFRLEILEGPSGIGKSRIIREVYRRHVRDQPEPAYWPQLLANPDDPLLLRKTLGPGRDPFTWPPDALPSFLWWDIECRICDDLQPSDALTEFGPFLTRHALPVALAVSRRRGMPETLAYELRSKWADLVEDGISEASSEAVGNLVQLLTPLDPIGVGWVMNRLRELVMWQVNRRRQLHMLEGTTALEGASDLTQDMAQTLSGLTAGTMPTVVAIEDVHYAGDDTAAFLRRLRDLKAPVTVLATAWPEGRHRPTYRGLLEDLSSSTTIHPVTDIQPPHIAALIRHFAPETRDEQARRIAAAWPNPCALLMLLTLPRVRRGIERNGGALTWGADLAAAPHSLQGLYHHRLEELPLPVREAVSIAAGSLPVGQRESATESFIPGLVATVACQLGAWNETLPTHEAVTAALASSADDYSWCVRPAPEIALFREPLLRTVARALFEEEVPAAESTELGSLVINALRSFLDGARGQGFDLPIDDPRVVLACSWLISLEEERDNG